MFRSINLSEAYLKDHKLRSDAKKEYELTKNNIKKIKSIALKLIKYPEYEEAFDYVDNLFPRVKVKDIAIYKVAARDLAKMGYAGAEGFYDCISKSIVVCGARSQVCSLNKKHNVTAKIERDEVIVHELCHYCYVFEGGRSVSSEMREEFAYGWSVGYLRGKGYTDEQIVKYNFLPYLVGVCSDQATKNILARNNISIYEYNKHSKFQRKEFQRTYYGKILERAKELAMEKGLKLIDLYSKKMDEGTVITDSREEDLDRFDILDL